MYMRSVWVFFQQNKTLMMILKKPQGAKTKQTLVPNTVSHEHTNMQQKISDGRFPGIIKMNDITEILVFEGMFRAFVQATV